jgi:hypothetical protein
MRKLLKRLLLSLLILHFISKSTVASDINQGTYNPPPIIEHDISLIATQDTYAKEQIWYGLPFNSRYILLGYDSVYKHMRTRPQLGFDFSQLENYTSKDIYKAYIALRNWRPLNNSPYSVKVYPITESWNERTVDWSNQPNVGEFHNLQTIQPVKGWQYFDVTNIVKVFKDEGQSIYGFALHKDLEYEFGAYFCSSNYLTATIIDDGCSEETIPKLIIQLNKKIEAPIIIVEEIKESEYKISTTNQFIEDVDYELSMSLDKSFSTSVIKSNTHGSFHISELAPGKYYYRMRAKFRDSNSDWSNVVMVEILSITEEKPQNEESESNEDGDETKNTPEEENNQQEPAEIIDETFKDKPLGKEISENNNITIPEEGVEETINIVELHSEVLGTSDSFYNCKIIYNVSKRTAKSPWCKIPKLKISNTINSVVTAKSELSITYARPSPINIIYEEIECQTKSLRNPKTWFSCIEKVTFSRGYYQSANYSGRLYIGAESKSFIITQTDSMQMNGKVVYDKTIQQQDTEIKHYVNFSFKPKDDVWIDVSRTISTDKIQIPKPTAAKQDQNSEKPFKLMLDLPVSVTQWHGNTSFQSPHHGIDFSVSNRNLYAIGNGIIEAKVWDSYGGECNSGGYALRIKHDNGMHSVYMHIKDDLDGSLTGRHVGSKVSKGDLVAISSNTGYYNCQPLSDHLHFELRRGRLQSTHIDPVPYINTDWNNILTKDHKTIPGRLTGDNPHPGR